MTAILVLILSENIGALKEGAEVGEKVWQYDSIYSKPDHYL